jgi:hypothetical protein
MRLSCVTPSLRMDRAAQLLHYNFVSYFSSDRIGPSSKVNPLSNCTLFQLSCRVSLVSRKFPSMPRALPQVSQVRASHSAHPLLRVIALVPFSQTFTADNPVSRRTCRLIDVSWSCYVSLVCRVRITMESLSLSLYSNSASQVFQSSVRRNLASALLGPFAISKLIVVMVACSFHFGSKIWQKEVDTNSPPLSSISSTNHQIDII